MNAHIFLAEICYKVEDAPLFPPTDFGEVKGQEHVKRALEVAPSGGHNVLTFGTTSRVLLDLVYDCPTARSTTMA